MLANSRAVNLPRRQSASVGDRAPKPSMDASVSTMNTGGGFQWNERGTDGLVLSTKIHQEISWRNVGDACAWWRDESLGRCVGGPTTPPG